MLQANVRGLFELARSFGPEGVEAALDVTEAAVGGATEAASVKLEECLKKHWPRSTVSQGVHGFVRSTATGIRGIVIAVHDWIEALALGKPVPRHRIPKAGFTPMVLRVGKGGEQKIDPRTGKHPIRLSANHPGYKGFDCATPAQREGERVFRTLINKAVLKFARKLTRGRG